MLRIENTKGMVLKATPWGAALTELHAFDRNGSLADITLGYQNPDDYRTNAFYFGAIAGRCANRIAKGRFSLAGTDYALATNNGPNHLHGGETGFDKREWAGETATTDRGQVIRFTYTSADGEEGYPGELRTHVTYTLTDANELITEIEASTSAPTLCNLAQHAYWNLSGHTAGPITDHEITLHADRYTPVDDGLIPTGELAPVEGTHFDLRTPTRLGDRIPFIGDDPRGIDHNFVVNGAPGTVRPVARVFDPGSGRVMELASDQPGVQFYTGNFLDGSCTGKGGVRYGRHTGFCLETQAFPDAIHRPEWMQPVLQPGETYRHTMVTRFSTDKD